MIFRPRPDDASPKERALWGDLLSLGLVFPTAIVLGFYLGRWIGGKLGHREAGQAALDVFTEWKSVYVDYSGTLQRAQIDNA